MLWLLRCCGNVNMKVPKQKPVPALVPGFKSYDSPLPISNIICRLSHAYGIVIIQSYDSRTHWEAKNYRARKWKLLSLSCRIQLSRLTHTLHSRAKPLGRSGSLQHRQTLFYLLHENDSYTHGCVKHIVSLPWTGLPWWRQPRGVIQPWHTVCFHHAVCRHFIMSATDVDQLYEPENVLNTFKISYTS